MRLVTGTVGLVAMGVLLGRSRAWMGAAYRPRTFVKVARAAFVGTFLGIWANQAGISWATHAGVAATLNALAPVFLVPLSAAFLGEPHDRRAWASALLAAGGVALMTLA